MKFHILTLFPEMVLQGLNTSIIKRAADGGIISLNVVNIRDYTADRHGKVDDYPYGGGAGMLMQAQPVYDAYLAVTGGRKVRTVYVTPQGQPFTQRMAEKLAKEEELVLLCGHYEGMDERVLEEIVTDHVSIGDYVLTGGELPAMVITDAVARLVPGVLNNEASAQTESFYNDLLEYPQYSRPRVWRGRAVPEVLLSGDHDRIASWRLEQSKRRTADRRPDLYNRYEEKMQVVEELSRRKREHIHMMEFLRRGKAQILYRRGENVLLFDDKDGIAMLTARDRSDGELMCGMLEGRDVSCFVVNQEALKEELEKRFGTSSSRSLVQACYTRKEPLPVRYKDIRRMDPPHFDCEESAAWFAGRFAGTDTVFGAFLDGKAVGWIGIGRDGSMGPLYVAKEARGQGIGTSLESFLINFLLQLGRTPYCQIEEDDEVLLKLQEKLGLYLSAGRLWHAKRGIAEAAVQPAPFAIPRSALQSPLTRADCS